MQTDGLGICIGLVQQRAGPPGREAVLNTERELRDAGQHREYNFFSRCFYQVFSLLTTD